MSQPSAPPEPQKALDFLRPAITAGFWLGALSSLPILSVACFIWIPGGGGYAAWLLNKQKPGGLKYGDGALVGVQSGLVGTIVSAIINVPVQLAMYTPAAVAEMQQQLKQFAVDLDLPPDFVTTMSRYLTPGFSLPRLLMGVIVFSIVGVLFAMIGGILTVGLLNRRRRQEEITRGDR